MIQAYHSHRWFFCLGLFALLTAVIWPQLALAASPNAGAGQFLSNCKAGYEDWRVATIIVKCVELTMKMSLAGYLGIFSQFMAPTTAAVFAFSMVLMGIQVFSGIKEFNKEVMIYIIKFGIVVWFSVNLGGFASAPFDIVQSLTTMVFGGYQPWGQMDDYFCQFFGTGCTIGGKTFELKDSFIAHAGPLLFSGTMGILVFVVGALAMLTSMYFMFRGIYTYLAAITLIAFILIMSPIFLPLLLFARTTRYLMKWIDYLLAAMLHPVILFGFLYLFLGTFDSMLQWFVNSVMGGESISEYWRSSETLFSWLVTADPQTVKDLEATIGQETNRTAVQSFLSPTMASAMNLNPMMNYSVDFGADHVMSMQRLVFGFLGLFIVSYLMFSMINYLPEISESIAGVVLGMRVEGIPFVNEMRYFMEKAKGAMT